MKKADFGRFPGRAARHPLNPHLLHPHLRQPKVFPQDVKVPFRKTLGFLENSPYQGKGKAIFKGKLGEFSLAMEGKIFPQKMFRVRGCDEALFGEEKRFFSEKGGGIQ